MDLNLEIEDGVIHKSLSQKIRILTEHWMGSNMYCPVCDNDRIYHYPNNTPVADFYCNICNNEFELKSKKGPFRGKVVDGAYNTMITRIQSENNPNFFFLEYNRKLLIENLILIPKQLFHPDIIQKRNPLSATARRAGWIGCNIILTQIPSIGKISIISEGVAIDKAIVRQNWHQSDFLIGKNLTTKGWILDVLRCIERIPSVNFTLNAVYKFENELKAKYPNNNFVKDKIRQQLQNLRDLNLIEFTSRGNYRKIK